MKNKKLLFLGFVFIILIVPIYIAFSSENVLKNGTYYKFRLQGRDPFDPLKGKYLMLNYAGLQIQTDDKFEVGEEVYVKIGVDPEGFAFFDSVHKSEPKKGDYLKTRVRDVYLSMNERNVFIEGDVQRSSGSNTVWIEIPDHMRKYFINEDFAKKGETVLFQERADIYVGVRVLEGECRLQDIYVKGKPLMEYLED